MKLKPGHTTTEFYLTITAGLIAVALDALGQIEGTTTAGLCTVLGLVYTVMRGKIKIAQVEAQAPSAPPSTINNPPSPLPPAALMLLLMLCLASCSLVERPPELPRDEPYPAGKTMESWIAELMGQTPHAALTPSK